uniref:Transposase domain-containing protein n=2 Tax=Clytia hemisphaerica TaxID=252671 RepID=A0A7M5X7A9_9CNID
MAPEENFNDNGNDDPMSEESSDTDDTPDHRIDAEVLDDTDSCDEFEDTPQNESIIFDDGNEKIIIMLMYQLFALQTTYSISDNVMGILLKLFHSFLTQLKSHDGVDDKLERTIELFPSSLFLAKKKINLENNSFVKYVSCGKCHSIYKPEDCYYEKDGKRESHCCTHVPYPDHPQARFREPCGETLMKSVSSGDGKKNYLHPKRLYCYQPLKQSLQNLISRNDLREKLLGGPSKGPEGVLFDTIDGKFWKEFKDNNGEIYFKDPRNLGAILNIDWFQPFDGVEYSCGVIYMALLNLPRELRFRWENITTVGIIPGPNEPSLNVNSYVKPLVDDLLTLWQGDMFEEKESRAMYKFALCCVSSDLPATRKLCGFVSYNAKQGCSKCFKQFEHDGPVGTTKTDYSGFDEENWTERDPKEHVRLAFKHKAAKTLAEAKETERDYGVRFSELCRLPYYDPVRCHLIDPMHCLLLGVAKNTLKIWIK